MNGTHMMTQGDTSRAQRWISGFFATGAAVLLAVMASVLGASSASAAPAPGQGEVYVLHGLAGVTADVLVDGTVEMRAAQPQTIVGPLSVTPGSHTVTLRPTTGAQLTATVNVTDGSSFDVVAHVPADAANGPVLTVFPNDLSPVGMGKSRLVVAHTAALPPADVRVDGAVLFSNVANAEALELMVPAGTYSVDIVPTGATSPVVFGPVSLPVEAGTLTRVFAFGDPTETTMNAIVQTLPVAQEGAAAPLLVPTGDGGQAALVTTGATVTEPWTVAAGIAVAAAAGALVLRRRRTTAARAA